MMVMLKLGDFLDAFSVFLAGAVTREKESYLGGSSPGACRQEEGRATCCWLAAMVLVESRTKKSCAGYSI